jgi:nitrate/TMAO reductase-like tetraheme cytochrome c subunit
MLAAVSLFFILFLFLISNIFPSQVSQYLGLFTYIILPVFLVIGLILIPIGTWRKYKRDKKGEVEREVKFPKIDLNEPGQRMVVFIFTLGSALFILFTALGSYEAFHITESNKFCGTLCHKVMSPEYTTYHQSAHAKVKCVECHVGSGATWYVKSKMSGLKQVYAILTHTYPVPITTPVHDLRPARETCEQCHWPQKFYNRTLINTKYYLSDSENSEWDVSMLMKTGPAHKALGLRSGIHWHVNPDVKIEYIPTSFKRDQIAEVKFTNLKTGKTHIYKDKNREFTAKALDTLKVNERVMDCMDCHNRPSHNFKSPTRFFDDAMSAGNVSQNLPDLKMMAMDLFYNNAFPTVDSADRYIQKNLTDYYKSNYPEIYDTAKAQIKSTIAALQHAYKENIFPTMKADWRAHPNYIGHMEANGCFRCHNGTFTNENGRTISKDCDLCHEIKAQGKPGQMEYAGSKSSLTFQHPVDIGGEWKTTACVECHKSLY